MPYLEQASPLTAEREEMINAIFSLKYFIACLIRWDDGELKSIKEASKYLKNKIKNQIGKLFCIFYGAFVTVFVIV